MSREKVEEKLIDFPQVMQFPKFLLTACILPPKRPTLTQELC
jgi:hypothetical protein